LSVLTPDRRRLHTLFASQRRNSQKGPETRSRGGDFKPIQTEFGLTAKAPCDYTKRPEVKAAHAESAATALARLPAAEACARGRFIPRPIGVGQVEDCFGEGQAPPSAPSACYRAQLGTRVRRYDERRTSECFRQATRARIGLVTVRRCSSRR
jgi:hypothetical protein